MHDSEFTRDIDDAIGLQVLSDGRVEVIVAVADPTRLVELGGDVDLAAQRQVASIYARDVTVKRMLPPGISEDGASLVMRAQRDAMVMRFELDPSSLACLDFGVDFRPSP